MKITNLKNVFHLMRPGDEVSNGVPKNSCQSLDEANYANQELNDNPKIEKIIKSS